MSPKFFNYGRIEIICYHENGEWISYKKAYPFWEGMLREICRAKTFSECKRETRETLNKIKSPVNV